MCAHVCVCVSVHAILDVGMYFTRPSEMNEYKYSKTASMLGKLVHVIRIFGVFTAIGKAQHCLVPLPIDRHHSLLYSARTVICLRG